MRVDLSEALIASATTISEDGRPVGTVSFSYGKITWTATDHEGSTSATFDTNTGAVSGS